MFTNKHTDSNGCTALHYAVTLGHADATYMLLDLGADPNRQDRKGRTPAHCGCAKGQFETVFQCFFESISFCMDFMIFYSFHFRMHR